MTKASDNAFPSLLITEGTEPSAPAAGKQRLYIDSTSHHLMRTNSSGTETDIESTASAPSFHGCRVYHSTTQTVTSAATTAMTFDSERFDTDTMHSTSSNQTRIVIPTTGYWHVGASVYWPTVTASKESYIALKVNGSTFIALQSVTSVASSSNLATVTTLYALTATDYVECLVFNAESSTITITNNPAAQPEFWAYLVGV